MKFVMKDNFVDRISEVLPHIESKNDWYDHAKESGYLDEDEGCITYTTEWNVITTPFVTIDGSIIITDVTIEDLDFSF